MKRLNFSLILTCAIDPKGMPNLIRNNIEDRLNDYKKSFNFWSTNKEIDKIIFIENSGYDLGYFKKKAQELSNKQIELISSTVNNNYDRSLGKGYGEYLCLKEIFDKSKIVNNTNYFIAVTGRHSVKNFSSILSDISSNNSDIYLNLKDNLKFADTNIYGGTKKFFTKYLIPETSKTNDAKNQFFEHCAANATLKAVSDGMTYSQIKVYADIEGFIGTNGKKIRTNIIKKIKLYFFGKLKKYFFNHKRH